MGLELKRCLELFFQKNWNKLSLIFLLCFLHCSFISNAQRTFLAFQFAHPITQNCSIWLRSYENIGKCLIIKTCFSNDGWFYLNPSTRSIVWQPHTLFVFFHHRCHHWSRGFKGRCEHCLQRRCSGLRLPFVYILCTVPRHLLFKVLRSCLRSRIRTIKVTSWAFTISGQCSRLPPQIKA
jgi:hypothetical protein